MCRGPRAGAAGGGRSRAGARRWSSRSSWPGLAGVDLLGPGDAAARSRLGGRDAVAVATTAWEAVRIEAGDAGRRAARSPRGPSPPRSAWSSGPSRSPRAASPARSWWPGSTPAGSKVARRLCGRGDRRRDGRRPARRSGQPSLTAERAPRSGLLTSVAWSPGIEPAVALATLHRRVAPPAGGRAALGGPTGTAAGRRPRPGRCRWSTGRARRAGRLRRPVDAILAPATARPAGSTVAGQDAESGGAGRPRRRQRRTAGTPTDRSRWTPSTSPPRPAIRPRSPPSSSGGSAACCPPAARPVISEVTSPESNGMSSETLLFTAALGRGRRAGRPPPGGADRAPGHRRTRSSPPTTSGCSSG